jgi:maleylpyruvate isomerase
MSDVGVPKLYGYWRSSASWRLRIIFNLKNIEFENIPINLVKGENKTDEYLKMHPLGLVPSVKFPDGTVVTESPAIAELVEELYPQPALIPGDAWRRAQVVWLTRSVK